MRACIGKVEQQFRRVPAKFRCVVDGKAPDVSSARVVATVNVGAGGLFSVIGEMFFLFSARASGM
jgi:hypothetical protein